MAKLIGTGMKRVDAPNKACGKALLFAEKLKNQD